MVDIATLLMRKPTLNEHRFLHELALMATAGRTPTAAEVGAPADQDDRETAEALAGLIGLQLVREAGTPPGSLASPFTQKPLELTGLGARFLTEAPALFDSPVPPAEPTQ